MREMRRKATGRARRAATVRGGAGGSGGRLVGAALVLALGASSAAAQQVVELPGRDRELAVPMEDVFSVGGAMEEAEWEIFGDLGSANLAFDGQGNLYVFDRDNARVVVIDRDGGLVREFGKQGEGPDEWRNPLSMSVLRDGTVVITDLGHRAYMVYGPDGTLRDRVEFEMGRGGFSLGALQPDPRGGHLFSNAGGGFRVRLDTGAGPADAEPGRAIERLSLADGSKSKVFTAWAPPPEEAAAPTVRTGGASFRMGGGPRTFEPRLHVGALPDGGLAVVDSSAYAIKMVGPDGALRRVVRRPSEEPRRVTGRIQEREKERRLDELEAGEGPQMRVVVSGPGGGGPAPISQEQMREMQRRQLEQMTFYDEIPVVQTLRAGWGGKLWIERTPSDWWEDGPVDVVTPAGEYLGTIPASGPGIPDAFGPAGLVAYLERDEFDVPTLVVKRLPVELR